MKFKNSIINAIKKDGKFDGVYYEKFFSDTIHLVNTKESFVRALIVENDVMIHVLDENDGTKFVSFDSLDNEEWKIAIFADICGHKVCDIDDFFEKMKDFLEDGDCLRVSYEIDEHGNEDYDNMVYSIYNGCNDILGEYHTKYNLYMKY